MKTLFILIVLLGLIFLVYKWIEMKKAVSTTDGYAQRKAVFYLFSAFIALIGITSIFAEAIFEMLGLRKPEQFEWYALAAYVAFCLATAIIFKGKNGDKETGAKINQAIQQNIGDGNVQNNTFN